MDITDETFEAAAAALRATERVSLDVVDELVRAVVEAVAPLIAAQALRSAADAARTCTQCGTIHESRVVSDPGAAVRRSWAHPDDGHSYRPAAPWHRDEFAPWLASLADAP